MSYLMALIQTCGMCAGETDHLPPLTDSASGYQDLTVSKKKKNKKNRCMECGKRTGLASTYFCRSVAVFSMQPLSFCVDLHSVCLCTCGFGLVRLVG